VVIDKADNVWCEKPYPEGGPRGGRGSTSVDRGAMMVNAAKRGQEDDEWYFGLELPRHDSCASNMIAIK